MNSPASTYAQQSENGRAENWRCLYAMALKGVAADPECVEARHVVAMFDRGGRVADKLIGATT